MSDCPIAQKWLDKMQGKEAFVERLFTVFVTEEPKRMETIRNAMEAEDTEHMAYLTHSLKGSAATMGAEDLRQAALKLELAGKENDLEHSEKCYEKLEEEIQRVYVFMNERLATMQG